MSIAPRHRHHTERKLAFGGALLLAATFSAIMWTSVFLVYEMLRAA